MPTITGTAHWAKVHEAANSPMYPDNYQYSIDIGPLSDDNIAELTSAGLAEKIVHEHGKKDYTPCISFKHPPVIWDTNPDDPDGERIEVAFEPRVVDTEMNDIPKTTLIGNDSTVRVVYKTFASKKYGTTSARFTAVQVLDLVHYAGGASDPMAELAAASAGESAAL
jgi:hypothetical protein|tara:strand:- start:1731 stop:2231 length:501 start_codon:yes stop_codon:yes gene_type:complete